MRIALHVEAELGVRIARVLLGEPDVEIGLFDDESPNPRVHTVDSVGDWDALLVDELSVGSRLRMEQAFAMGVPVVFAEEGPTVDASSVTMVAGARTGARLAMALAQSNEEDELMEAQLAWTVQGHPLRDGVAVTFPDPVGALWADGADVPNTDLPVRGLAAPINAAWRAVVARLTCATDDGIETRILGIADDRNFMDAVVLAAAALTAAKGAYPPGVGGPGDPDGVFLRQLEASGLHVASFTPEPT